MKTKIFKMLMPVLAIILAIGGSFATHAAEKKADQTIIGYATSINGTPCSIIIICGQIPNTICVIIIIGIPTQAWGKFNPNDTACPIILRRADL